MKREFALPDLGEGIAEGEVVAWHVEPGDRVEEDDVIAEVETDKALVDLPSPYEGEIVELRAEEGDIVPVETVLVEFEVEGEESAEGDEETETPSEPEAVGVPEGERGSKRVFATPRVRRIARERGVEITRLATENGRITERDVLEAAGEATTTPSPETGDGQEERSPAVESPDVAATTRDSTVAATAEADRDRTLAVPATRRVAREEGVDIDAVPASGQRNGEAFVTAEDVRAFAQGERKPAVEDPSPAPSGTDTETHQPGDRIAYTGIRRTIGERMAESKFTAPHVSHHDEVEVSSLVDIRERLKSPAESKGIRLTYLPFAVKAACAALQAVPAINSELDEEAEEIILHDHYHIGIAVASDAGLMVPVIEDVDEKGLLELAAEINDKAERARERTIDLEELQGGTFTITNIGPIGGEYASPIINHPEAAILALGEMKERPWVEDGDVVARPTIPISMTSDHRLVDGAEAARFTNEIKRYLHDPELLLLE